MKVLSRDFIVEFMSKVMSKKKNQLKKVQNFLLVFSND